MSNVTNQLLDRLLAISNDNLDSEVINKAKLCILDYLGVTFYGAIFVKQMNHISLQNVSPYDSGVSLIGHGKKSNVYDAALINGICSHIAELDDGSRFGMIHPGAPILSALFPLAEQEQVNGEQFIKGLVAGYEAAIRIAKVIQPYHKQHGFHATGTCGTIGAAVACATALTFKQESMKSAISAAATGAAGLLAMQDNSSELKPYNVGHASVSGLTAVYTAQFGFMGPSDILGGKRGFFQVFSNPDSINQIGRNEKLGIETIYFKRHAACRHCHPAIDSALMLMKEKKFAIVDIKLIIVKTYSLAIEGHDHTNIDGLASAKMSIPYSIAIALVFGSAGVEAFTEKNIFDSRVQSLAQKVKVLSDEGFSKSVPKMRPANILIKTLNGEIHSHQVDHPKGEPENPLDEKEIIDKFWALSLSSGKASNEIEKIVQIIKNIESDLRTLYPFL